MPGTGVPARAGAGFAAALILLLLLLAAGCGGGSGSDTGTAAAPDRSQGRSDSDVAEADWPYFGRVPQRTHYLPIPLSELHPPLREAWSINTHALIEFPPAIAGGVAYLVNKYGNTMAVRIRDHEVLWSHVIRRRLHGPPLDVTGPAYHAGRVYYAGIGGYLVALNADDGSVAWYRDLHAHLESSPLIVGRTLYIGTDSSQLLALNAVNGRTRWRFDAPGAIKASPSFNRGRVFVADYQSSMFALDARTGRPLWRTNTSRQKPFGKGGFYSSPAVAFGRVYAARDDGTVFAFDERSGKVAWSFPTGAAAYGSPAVARVPGTPPTVYIGAENGRFFALDARSGRERWHYDVGGPIPGTATVIGTTVFTSSFRTRKAIGLDVRTHKPDFLVDTAGYNPVVSNGRHLLVVGYYKLVGLAPKHRSNPTH
ncbi:MAG TPA: PQQ-binding-like beta-propeller repeat protein [Solirubrobacterales bacterium]|nr:PQQ-binding-like beta-propeller repeat protein [Solirubrobacterales bacterium]